MASFAVIASNRWFLSIELKHILTNFISLGFALQSEVVSRPPSGAFYLANKKVLKQWRRDGYRWRLRKDGKTPIEHHEKLKLEGGGSINCVYAYSDESPTFHRRAYALIDDPLIILVHYLDCESLPKRARAVTHAASARVSPPPALFLSLDEPLPPNLDGLDDLDHVNTLLPSLPASPLWAPHSPRPDAWPFTGPPTVTSVSFASGQPHAPQSPPPSAPAPAAPPMTRHHLASPVWGAWTAPSASGGDIDVDSMQQQSPRLSSLLLPLPLPQPQPQLSPPRPHHHLRPFAQGPPVSPVAALQPSTSVSVSSVSMSWTAHAMRVALVESVLELQQAFHRPDLTLFSFVDLHLSLSHGPDDDWLEVLIARVLERTVVLADSGPVLRAWGSASRGPHGWHVFHLFAGLGYAHLISFLLQYRLDLDCLDTDGRTPLHYAACIGSEAAVMTLISYGADERRCDACGLDAAALATAHGHVRLASLCAQLRRDHDADADSFTADADADSGNRVCAPWTDIGRKKEVLCLSGDGCGPESDDELLDETVSSFASAPSHLQSQSQSQCHSLSNSTFSSASSSSSTFSPTFSSASSSDSSSTHSVLSSAAVMRDTFASALKTMPDLEKQFSSLTMEELGISALDIDNPSLAPEAFDSAVAAIQQSIRLWLVRRHAAAKTLQSATRAWLQRRSLKRRHESAIVIQSFVRTRAAQTRFRRLRAAAVALQRRFRERHALTLGDQAPHTLAAQDLTAGSIADDER